MSPLVKQGHVYLACPPLYKLSQGNKTEYAIDETERDILLKKAFRSGKVDISRFKGLGEMRPQQLRDTTMKVEKRKLLRVLIDDTNLTEQSSLSEILEFVDKLMGRNPQERYNFIQNNALAVAELDV
jgi:topoisomerase-4 subunit B